MARRDAQIATLSIIIPTLNEEVALPATLVAASSACPDAQILVVDGGSKDGTVAIAEAAGIRIIQTQRGRGHQQNAGVAVAQGEVLLFLHADTLLPEGTGGAIARALSDPGFVGGNFRLAFHPNGLLNRIFALLYNARSLRSRHYYGDSCLFIRRTVFEELGGFREGMLMEDWEFVQRLEAYCRANGKRTACLPLTVTTSARRFSGRRRWRYVYLWTYLHYLHARGISGDKLATLYPDVR